MAKYNYELKKKIVNAYMNGEGGEKFLANKYCLKSSTNVMKWVNDFRIAGPLKPLEDKNLKLRIENAYLKELRRLRLEGKPQNKKRESSAASEDHSN